MTWTKERLLIMVKMNEQRISIISPAAIALKRHPYHDGWMDDKRIYSYWVNLGGHVVH